MKLLTKRGTIRCGHDGGVVNVPSQSWVRINSSAVLVEPDPQGRGLHMCPNVGVNIKPCTLTLSVERGYSVFLRIGQQAVCLDSIQGFTDGTPPGAVKYTVRFPGQTFVGATS